MVRGRRKGFPTRLLFRFRQILTSWKAGLKCGKTLYAFPSSFASSPPHTRTCSRISSRRQKLPKPVKQTFSGTSLQGTAADSHHFPLSTKLRFPPSEATPQSDEQAITLPGALYPLLTPPSLPLPFPGLVAPRLALEYFPPYELGPSTDPLRQNILMVEEGLPLVSKGPCPRML